MLAAVRGPELLELDVAADAEAWASAGFAIEDGACRIGGVTLRFSDARDGGIVGWGLEGLAEGAIDGLATRGAVDDGREPHLHPNGAVRLDHLVVMTPDVERTSRALLEAGFDRRRVREAGEIRQAFFWAGATLLEVGGPAEPREGGGPARFWGLVVVVNDIDRTALLLGDKLGRVKDAVQPGRRIATLRAEAGLGVPIAFMTPHVAAD